MLPVSDRKKEARSSQVFRGNCCFSVFLFSCSPESEKINFVCRKGMRTDYNLQLRYKYLPFQL